MSSNSSIEWTDTTWNPVTGCTKVSPGCAHCYAETLYERFNGKGSFATVTVHPERLSLPLSWKKPRRVFVNSMSDLFHEDVPFEFIDRVFAVMAKSPKHTFQILTKRPERMRAYLTDTGVEARLWRLIAPQTTVGTDEWVRRRIALNEYWPLPNVWLGTSTENQHWLDIRVPELLATPAAVRFLSCEPLLGPLDLTRIDATSDSDPGFSALYWDEDYEGTLGDATIDWVIVGGESGPGARPFDLAWARSIVSQCRAAGVAVFVKQLGRWAVDSHGLGPNWLDKSEPVHLKSRKGGDMAEWPEDLRVREMPR